LRSDGRIVGIKRELSAGDADPGQVQAKSEAKDENGAAGHRSSIAAATFKRFTAE
jgi:hypothetical protein